jgi:hypothetical protein
MQRTGSQQHAANRIGSSSRYLAMDQQQAAAGRWPGEDLSNGQWKGRRREVSGGVGFVGAGDIVSGG